MQYHVVSLDGTTFAPDGTEFNNMQILGCVEADNIVEARKKFLEENRDMLSHGYEDKFPLKFYAAEDAWEPEGSDEYCEFSLKENIITFFGASIGSLRVPLDDEMKRFIDENELPADELMEFCEDDVWELYHKVVSKLMASI